MKILRQQQIELKDFDQEDIHKFYLYAGKDMYDKYETRSTSNRLNTIKRGSFKVSDIPKEEVEIRANTLKVIDYIYETLDRKYSRMDINDFIWLLGQDKSKMIKPYHRTLTKHY